MGLLLFTLTVIVAAVTWFSVEGWLTGLVTAIVTGTVGALDVTIPVFLFWATLRVLRHPDQGSTTGRLAIGSGILLAASCGIWSLVQGAPRPSDGAEALRAAGGWVGWLVTAPIVSAVGIWLAYLWLVVLLGFGLLVVTATPIHAVPDRLGALRDAVLLRRTPAVDAGEEESPAGDMAVDGRAKHAALVQDPIEADDVVAGPAGGEEGAEVPADAAPAGTPVKPSAATALKARVGGLLRGMRRSPKQADVAVYDGPLAGDEAFISAVATAPTADAPGGDATLVDALFDPAVLAGNPTGPHDQTVSVPGLAAAEALEGDAVPADPDLASLVAAVDPPRPPSRASTTPSRSPGRSSCACPGHRTTGCPPRPC